MTKFLLSAFADEANQNLDEQIKNLKEQGITKIELRGVDGINCSDLTEDKAKEVAAKLKDAGISLSALGSPYGKIGINDDFEPHFSKFEKSLEICKILDCNRIRMFSFYIPEGENPEKYKDAVIERLERMVELAKEYGVYLCHENEKGIYGDTDDRCMELYEHFKDRMGIIFDPANYIQCGVDPLKAYQKQKGTITYFHIKDALKSDGSVVSAGNGDGSIKDILADCAASDDFTSDNGVVILTVEPHLHVFNGLKDLQSEEVRHHESYETSEDAFCAACKALKDILNSINPNSVSIQKVKLGIIGVGGIAGMHIDNILSGKCPNIEITAVADRRSVRRDWAKETLPDAVVFEEGSDLIKSGLCEAVLIAVPHYQHPILTMQALENGLHVMSEKPAGVYTLQVREEIAVADKHPDLTFAMMFNQRTNCVYKKIKEMVAGGEIGELKRINWIVTDWYRTQFYYDSGDWRATWAGEGGGVLLNQDPHQLDLLQWMFGMPIRIRAFCHEAKWHDIEVEDDVTAYMEFANGATGVFVTTTGDAPGTNRLEVTGTRGKLVCENNVLTFTHLEEDERAWNKSAQIGYACPPMTVNVVETDGENPQHVGVMNAFINHIRKGEPLVADGREGINGLMISNAMYLSSWTDSTVSLPIDEEKFLELLNEKRKTSKHKEDKGIILSTQGSFGSTWQWTGKK